MAGVSQLARRMMDHAAEVRMRVADHYCPAKAHSGEHNNITVQLWFRSFDVCASCGYVERAR